MGFNWRDWPLALGRLQPMEQRPKAFRALYFPFRFPQLLSGDNLSWIQYTILYSVSKILLNRAGLETCRIVSF